MSATLDNYKLSCELLGHSMDVRALATGGFTPEGEQTIFSGSRDKTVKVWRSIGSNEYSESLTYQDHSKFVACVLYLEAEKWVCTGSNDATVCVYREGGYVPLLTLKGHESTVCSIAHGVEPQSIITGSWDKTARVWQIDHKGVTSVVLQGHEAAVWAVATLRTSKKYITGSADKTIYYWNTKGEKLRMLKGHTDCVRGILTMPNEWVVTCGNDATIRYWNEDGECVRELSGHTNYIYAIAQNRALGDEVVVTCGEDSTLRMWDLSTGQEMGAPIVHPAQSVWAVVCLRNGDIVTGSSDGVIRIFTKDPTRTAREPILNAFKATVEARMAQMSEELGGVKKTDLPGPEVLLSKGTQEGQTKMVRHPDGSVKCYSWELDKWNLVGDVTGASGGSQATSGKTLYEGKEYDYVFSVDISDTIPPIKLPYNRGEDPWHAAQKFIDTHSLPQAYLDQVANFIIKNSENNQLITQPTTSGYQDPFTGGARYVPGMNNHNPQPGGSLDPFTGASSYTTPAAQQQPNAGGSFTQGEDKHFPISRYVTFDNCDLAKVLDKLKEFNNKITAERVSETFLMAVVKLADADNEIDKTAIEALQHLLHWPSDMLFPVLDVTRLAVRTEAIFRILNSFNFLDIILPQLNSSVPNQLMIVRSLANMMCHQAGRHEVDTRLPTLMQQINTIKSGSANLQIAIATFFLNVTIAQTLALANRDTCALITEGLIELLKWAVDLEACYRAMQAIGNLTTTPFGQETAAQVISVEYVMDKIRELTNTPQVGAFTKLNSIGTALLAAF